MARKWKNPELRRQRLKDKALEQWTNPITRNNILLRLWRKPRQLRLPFSKGEWISMTHSGRKRTEQTCKNISKAQTGIQRKPQSPGTQEKKSLTMRKLWLDPEFATMVIKSWRKKPNKTETRLMELLDNYFPEEWKYVGNGELIIGGKCPDFANINGRKDLIELFGRHWHKPEEEQLRIVHFKNYGYNLLVIWENELKDTQTLISKLDRYNRKC